MGKDYYLGVDSASAIQLYPNFDFKQDKEKDESIHRSRGENLNLTKYKWGEYDKFSFSVDWVTDSDSQQINYWWDNNTNLVFFIVNSAGTCTSYNVQLMGNSRPFQKTNKPYIDLWEGAILLESYN